MHVSTELDTATLAVQGPLADDVMSALGCGWVGELDHFQRRAATIDGSTVDRQPLRLERPGRLRAVPRRSAAADRLWRAVAKPAPTFGIGPGNPNQADRIENALLSYGTDTGFHADPFELGLGDHLDLDGADFIGREALVAIRSAGPERRLLGAVVGGDPIERFGHPTPIQMDGDAVGELRAAAWSSKYSCNLGLALVDAAVGPGADGSTATPTQQRSLRLVELPFSSTWAHRGPIEAPAGRT